MGPHCLLPENNSVIHQRTNTASSVYQVMERSVVTMIVWNHTKYKPFGESVGVSDSISFPATKRQTWAACTGLPSSTPISKAGTR